MDIEGAEVSALRGAQKTIEKNIPIMAISIYHRIDDYWMIPQYINNLNLGYELYVRHYWKCTGTDTVLFAIPKSRR